MMRMRPNSPGVRARSLLSKIARPRMVPRGRVEPVVDEVHAALRVGSRSLVRATDDFVGVAAAGRAMSLPAPCWV